MNVNRMKKKYSKPGIIIEDFTIAQNIAQNCGNAGFAGQKHTYADKTSCGWHVGDVVIFVKEQTCEEVIDPDVPYEDLCYNTPSPGQVVFGSY